MHTLLNFNIGANLKIGKQYVNIKLIDLEYYGKLIIVWKFAKKKRFTKVFQGPPIQSAEVAHIF